MGSRKTKDLVKLIERRAGDFNSSIEAQQLIEQGADITATTKNGSMIDSVIAEENRLQKVTPERAQCCQRLVKILIDHASR